MLPLQKTMSVLGRMAEGTGSPIATHWMDVAAGCPGDTAKTRRFLCRLRDHGLVEGMEASRSRSTSGRVFWWKITDKGRAFLTTFAGHVAALADREQPGTQSQSDGVNNDPTP